MSQNLTTLFQLCCTLIVVFNFTVLTTCKNDLFGEDDLQFGTNIELYSGKSVDMQNEVSIDFHEKTSSSNFGDNSLGKYGGEVSLIEYQEPTPKSKYVEEMPPGWVDPFDMSLDKDRSGWVDPFDLTPLVEEKIQFNRLKPKSHDGKELTFLIRFVNIFLKALDFENNKKSYSSSSKKSRESILCKLEFLISEDDLTTLRTFSNIPKNGDYNHRILEEVDDVLTRIMPRRSEGKVDLNFGIDFQLLWKKAVGVMSKFLSSPEWTVTSSVLIMFFMTLYFTQTHSYRLALFTFLITAFFCGFGVTWLRMYDEKLVERYASLVINGHTPYHCSGHSMAWYEHVYFNVFGIDCLTFFKERDVRPMLKVSPTDVLAETISTMFISPATNFGKAYGSFVYSVTVSAPFYIKPIAIVMGFVLPLLFTIVVLCFLFNYEVGITPFSFYLRPVLFSRKMTSINRTHNNVGENYIEDISEKVNTGIESLKADSSKSNGNTNQSCENESTIKKKPNVSASPPLSRSKNRAIMLNNDADVEEELHRISLEEDTNFQPFMKKCDSKSNETCVGTSKQ